MSMMIPIENLKLNKCYEIANDGSKALVEIDILDGEYCGRNSNPPIKAVDAIPRQQIDKLLRILKA